MATKEETSAGGKKEERIKREGKKIDYSRKERMEKKRKNDSIKKKR
jgi:hypothetical protein